MSLSVTTRAATGVKKFCKHSIRRQLETLEGVFTQIQDESSTKNSERVYTNRILGFFFSKERRKII